MALSEFETALLKRLDTLHQDLQTLAQQFMMLNSKIK
jgi:hypothetical protein